MLQHLEHSLSSSLISNWIFFTFASPLFTNSKPPHSPWIWSSSLLHFFSTFFMLTSVYRLLLVIRCCVNYWWTVLMLLSCGYGGLHSVLLCVWVCVLPFTQGCIHTRTLPKCKYVNKVRSNFHSFFQRVLKAFWVLTHSSVTTLTV